jgi:hypothetical protein
MTLGSNRGQSTHIALEPWSSKPHEFSARGQVGQESNLHPAVVETQSGVSGGVARHRHVPICPTHPVAFYGRMSPCVVGHWGRYWGSGCFLKPRPRHILADPEAQAVFKERLR